ncbi:SDR family oxidoreductase [Nocardioides sp. CFH 31398]|uniref:SDR family oxidoreductase n=1 Tax=Nocardioides sp. CFH 31398 TaxID=2919579 RepID=UPI001F05F05C|nr:SDR family oxidoreductase [Nocardioides sp. CFH 31398]MCH1866622.1 SDR family oxidoreductase [Nocardioides sp. CFH 31398]
MGVHLLTGAGSGIGELVARALHDRGDELWLLARSPERAEELAAAFEGARTLVADLADASAVSALEVPPAVDGVVHSAGVVDVGPLTDTDPADLERAVAVNLVAPMVLSRLVVPAVRRARGTHVFVNSGSGLRAKADWASYNASKFGLRGFADALRSEEAGHGVRVTTVYPGRVATPMQERVHAAEGASYDASRWIRPETVAAQVVAVLDLAEDATIPDLTISPR